MVNDIENFFNYAEKMISFLKQFMLIPILNFRMTVGVIIFVLLVIILNIGITYNNIILIKTIKYISIIYFTLLIYLSIIDKYIPYFSHKALFSGMLYFSIATILFLYIMNFLLLENGLLPAFRVFCISSFVFMTFWFMHHIIKSTVQLSEIKIRLKLYIALGASLSGILLLFDNTNYIRILLTNIAICFPWVNYFIDLFEKKRNDSLTKKVLHH